VQFSLPRYVFCVVFTVRFDQRVGCLMCRL
jgi:hypothetical protein